MKLTRKTPLKPINTRLLCLVLTLDSTAGYAAADRAAETRTNSILFDQIPSQRFRIQQLEAYEFPTGLHVSGFVRHAGTRIHKPIGHLDVTLSSSAETVVEQKMVAFPENSLSRLVRQHVGAAHAAHAAN